MSPALHLGIAGWSYEDWQGIVYPRGCRDRLRCCAALVDCIEINSSFYALPEPRRAESWAERTADLETFFTAKLPHELTHQGSRDPVLVEQTRLCFAPLAEAGKLRALLAQFSYRFTAGPENLGHLRFLAEAFSERVPLVVELRHRSWAEPRVLEELGGLGVSVANLDYPGASSGFGLAVTDINGPTGLAYLRLHGRNRRAWFSAKADRDQVYDWEYSKAEVEEIRERASEIARSATSTVVIANNHFHGKAMKLVLELLAWFRQRRVEVPGEMLSAYPSLQAIARRAQGGLFDAG